MVCAVLCAGLYPNVIQCKRRGKRTAFYSKEVGKADIHPSSVNAGVHLFPLPYMVYSEKVKTTGIYIRDSTNISDYALLLFGGSFMPSKTGEGIEMLGGYLHFSAPKSVIQLIQVTKCYHCWNPIKLDDNYYGLIVFSFGSKCEFHLLLRGGKRGQNILRP